MRDVAPARKLPKKPTHLEAFGLNMAAAVRMVDLAEPLANQRSKGIYSSTGERLGDALRLTQAERSEIDVAESDDFYIIIKRGSTLRLRDAESGTRNGSGRCRLLGSAGPAESRQLRHRDVTIISAHANRFERLADEPAGAGRKLDGPVVARVAPQHHSQ